MTKKFKILYCAQENKYYIGYLIREFKGINQWAIVENRMRNLFETACKNVEDIVNLTENDHLTVLNKNNAWSM